MSAWAEATYVINSISSLLEIERYFNDEGRELISSLNNELKRIFDYLTPDIQDKIMNQVPAANFFVQNYQEIATEIQDLQDQIAAVNGRIVYISATQPQLASNDTIWFVTSGG